jgi:hypothetical protein
MGAERFHSGRRTFLQGLAALPLALEKGNSEKGPETTYRFLTPECEVRMSVQSYGNSKTKEFRFWDRVTNRAFCLSADGEENRNCLSQFVGSMAIATYHFRPRNHGGAPPRLREHVRTIDQDYRMDPRSPFERVLGVEKGFASDIQAFGYNRDGSPEAVANAKSFTLWCLLHQDLYLNDQAVPFLIVHWKHTLEAISLVDVIPGDKTEWVKG